jgi:hypothetical protein
MKFPFFIRNQKSPDICPVSGIQLRISSGVPRGRIFNHVGIWRKTACFATLNSTILGNPYHFRDLPPVSFMWSEKQTPVKGWIPIHCEHGWMPRDAYQISAMGCNQQHPVAELLRDPDAEISEAEPPELEKMNHLRLAFPPPLPPGDLCDKPFFVFALQLTTDLNLQRCGLDMANVATRADGGKTLLQTLSGMLAACHPDARVIFLQHPADKAKFAAAKSLRPNHVYVPKERRLRFLDLAMSPACQGVISINSNALNEAMLFSKPVFQMGDFLMKRFPNRLFPYSLPEFLDQPRHCHDLSAPLGYIAALMRNQYSLGDLANPMTLRNLILKETARAPLPG